MRKLLWFEFEKKWRSYRAFFLGAIAMLLISVPLLTISVYNKFYVAAGIAGFLYAITIAALMLLPFADGILGFHHDISGKQAPLELLVPLSSWKKVLSKLIAALCSIIITSLLSLLTVVFLMIQALNLNGQIRDIFNFSITYMNLSPLECIGSALVSLVNFFVFFTLVFFCIALAKSISQKNKVAVPLAIGVYIVSTIVTSLLEQLGNAIPIVFITLQNDSKSLTGLLFDLVIIAAAFFGTSWLVEEKIES